MHSGIKHAARAKLVFMMDSLQWTGNTKEKQSNVVTANSLIEAQTLSTGASFIRTYVEKHV